MFSPGNLISSFISNWLATSVAAMKEITKHPISSNQNPVDLHGSIIITAHHVSRRFFGHRRKNPI